MKSFRRNKRGQFVIVAALIIAVLTLATVISVYEINLNSQTLTYKPVDEFLLGVTSDMNRALTVALSRDSADRVNGISPSAADANGQQYMDNWQQTLFKAYSNYGFELNQPISTTFMCDWERNPGYSSALTTYDFDVASYGFLGWEGQTIKYVQLQLLSVNRVGPNQTELKFQLTQSVVDSNTTVPIPDLPSNPDISDFKVGAYTPGEPFNPASSSSLTYLGDGTYSTVFNQARDQAQGIRLDLMVPGDKIWVSATLRPGEGSLDSLMNPSLITTPPSDSVVGQAFFDKAILKDATSNAGGTVTYTLFSGIFPDGTQIGNPSTVNVVNGVVPNSALYSADAAGPYYFVASYSGDLSNNPVSGDPEPFTVGTAVISLNKANPSLTTNPPGGKIGVPSNSVNVTMPVYTQSTYSVTLKDPSNHAYGALGLWQANYWVGQIPLQLSNGTSSYQTISYCMNFDKEAFIGKTNPGTMTPTVDNETWRAVSYVLSWSDVTDDTKAAVQQVALWRILDDNYYRPSWLSTSIDNQAIALVNSASGKDVVRQGDTLKWISPLGGNMSAISLLPGCNITFTGQLTTASGAPRPNVQLLFNASLIYGDSSLELNSTYVNPVSAFTDSQGMVQVNVKVPQDTPLGATITVQAQSKSMWPQMYVNLNNVQYQNLLVVSPILNMNFSTNIGGSINVDAVAFAGTPFSDAATLTGATANAGGTVTYTLYSGTYPSGHQVGVSQVSVSSGAIPNSDSFTVSTIGPYYFIAAYSGDANNNPTVGIAEPFIVSGSLSLSTTPPASAIAGIAFWDQATLNGVTSDAKGTVTYFLFKGTYPTGTLLGSGQVAVSNGVIPNSETFSVTSSGPYYFIAEYSGDENNNPVNGEVEAFSVANPPYSGIPCYFYGNGTQNPWLDDLPPLVSDKINSYISNGQTTSLVQAQTGLSQDMVISDKVNVTLYLSTSQAISALNIDVGFHYQNHYYDVGSNTIHNIPKNTANKPYSTTITVNANNQILVPGFPALTIPKGSLISVTTTAPGYTGRITLYYGPGQLSQINF